jgi:4-hydroxy-2-oxoglutarate aldolase
MVMDRLKGVLAPIPTPFGEDGELALDRLAANLERWNDQPLDGYVVGGSNGEFVTLTPEERVRVVEAARKSVPRERLLIAGAGTESTRETIDLSKRMARVVADAVIVVTPSYYRSRMTASALEAHYRAVADACPVPLLLYSVPAHTALDLPADTAVRLSHYPNVLGIKDSGGDVTKIARMVRESAAGFRVLAGSAGFFLAALAVGAVGGVMALANLAPGKLNDCYRAYARGDLETARAIQLSLVEANTAVTARFGVAGLKAALEEMGYYGGPVRPPLMPLVPAERDELRGILQRAGLIS